MPLDGTRESGYLTKTSLSVIVVIVVAITAMVSIRNATATKYPAEINLTITRATMIQGFNAFEGCDFTGHPFRVGIVRNEGIAAEVRESPGVGRITPDNDCRYTITAEIEEADRYGIRFDNAELRFTDWFDSDEVEEEGEDGDTRLVFTVEW